ncbi:MAG TPA: rod shape-determining protein MreC [Candidatus Onthomonas avicola]|nr:rod shape-determining protein MreC [Candidatus Onthomonas avicola]
MKDFFRKNGIVLLIAALVLTGVISIGSAVMPVNPLTNLLGILATPFRAAATAVVSWGEGVYRYATEYEALQERVAELERELAETEAANREAASALEENERLRDLLELRQRRRDFVFESAAVTGRTSTSWEATLTISKGSAHGVAEGDSVITETGALVGVVDEAGLNWSTVTTIIDPDISVGATVFRTADSGILEGDLTLMTQGACRLSYLSAQAELVSGDEVLTSGTGGLYPSGLVIGYIEGVYTDPSGLEQYAVLRPAADLDALAQVFVIKDFEIIE